ncbi:MAG TPA: hypothetical protein VNA44_08775 [Burkholderiaceae bacterium]|nr:hypothetical protein [Burkholderiaceae bacterium]
MFTWTFNHLTGFWPQRSKAFKAAPKAHPAAAAEVSSAPATGLADNPHLAARRAQALRSLFPKLSSWFGSRRDALLIGEINEYLSQASNVTDLEQRIRLIEQQRHFS